MRKFITSATLLVAASQLLSRILGVVRDRVFAHIFGATAGIGIFQIDTYYAAFRLPDLVYSLLIFGTLSAAFIPLLAERKDAINRVSAENHFTSNVLNTLLIGVLILSAGIFIFAEPLTKLITPGFSAEEILLTSKLLRIQLLAPIFFTFSAVFGGLAQHFHKFVWYSLAPVFYNAGIIFGTMFWGREFGVFGASWGVALGAGLHALIQAPGVFLNGFRWKAVLKIRELKSFFRLAAPRVASVAASQLQLVAITIFASLIGGGALAVFNYSFNLASLPLGVVGIAFATTSFAGLAKLAGNTEKFKQKLQHNILGILFWTIPSAVGLFLLREEITRLILAGGEFGETDVVLVAKSLAVLAFAIPAMSLLPLLNNAFFARKNARLPLLAGAASLNAVILAGFLASENSSVTGLATAFAVAAITATGLLFILLPKTLRKIPIAPFLKILFASAVLGLSVFGLRSYWPAESLAELALKVGGLALAGGILYLILAKILKLRV